MHAERFVIALVKKDTLERFVFLFGRGDRKELAKVLDRYARDPELSFSADDAVIVSGRVDAVLEGAAAEGLDQ